MSGRRLGVEISPVRRKLDNEAASWEPDPVTCTVVTIESDKGERVVRQWLEARFRSVSIWFIYEVMGKPTHREYVFRCEGMRGAT